MDANTVGAMAAISASIAALAAAGGLFLQTKAIRQSRRVVELQIFQEVFRDLREFERSVHEVDQRDVKWEQWRGLFLQTLEYFCFLANEEYLSDERLVSYFKRAVVEWHRRVFLAHAGETERDDPKVYPELRKFVAQASKQ